MWNITKSKHCKSSAVTESAPVLALNATFEVDYWSRNTFGHSVKDRYRKDAAHHASPQEDITRDHTWSHIPSLKWSNFQAADNYFVPKSVLPCKHSKQLKEKTWTTLDWWCHWSSKLHWYICNKLLRRATGRRDESILLFWCGWVSSAECSHFPCSSKRTCLSDIKIGEPVWSFHNYSALHICLSSSLCITQEDLAFSLGCSAV